MAARTGMTSLIARWRQLVDDKGTVTWSNDEAQVILDQCRREFWNEALVPVSNHALGTATYFVYKAPVGNLEVETSGTTAWHVFASSGTTYGTADYTLDGVTGTLTFSTDQRGSARYFNGRSYDLYKAAAMGWEQKASLSASLYDFQADGGRFSRSQWFDHCMALKAQYEAQASGGLTFSFMVRTDLA